MIFDATAIIFILRETITSLCCRVVKFM